MIVVIGVCAKTLPFLSTEFLKGMSSSITFGRKLTAVANYINIFKIGNVSIYMSFYKSTEKLLLAIKRKR